MKSNRGKLIVLSGPSGVGKGTVVKALLSKCENLRLSVSATTRQPRDEDKEGVTYYFKSQEEFKKMIDEGEFLEWAMYNGNYYGTPQKAVNDLLDKGISVILEIEVQGAMNVKKKCPDAIYIFIAPPSLEELKKRLTGRGSETAESIAGRIAAAKAELEMKDEYDYIIVNDVREKAIAEVLNIIEKD